MTAKEFDDAFDAGDDITPFLDLTKVKRPGISVTHNASVRALEQCLSYLPQVDVQTHNLVHGQMCARTIHIPKGSLLTGAETNIDNISVICGDVTVTTTEGVVRLTGFNVLPAKAGYKRAVIAHEDTYWTTFHHTEHTNMADIAKEMTDEHENLQCKAVVEIDNKETLWVG